MHYGIGIGSKTSTGGEVVEGNSFIIFDGMVASSIGHMATCSVCKQGSGPIVGVGPRDCTLPAGPAARAGDYVACGCPPGTNVLLPSGTIQIGTHNAAQSSAISTTPQPSRYTVTIYTAAPGTPLRDSPNDPSGAGHMWFGITAIDSGLSGDEKSYGFGPNKTGIRGPGHIARSDSQNYIAPYYARTMEITKQQYERLYEFGETGVQKKETYFNLYYYGTHNSCIDFTNAALRFAGLNPTYIKPAVTPSRADPVPYEDKDYEGKLKVLDNIPKVKQIPAPFPNSELNMERYNKMPERTPVQYLLSQQGANGRSGKTTV